MRRLTWAQVRARRLERHALAAPGTAPVAEVVSAMCGAHAQVASAVELTDRPVARLGPWAGDRVMEAFCGHVAALDGSHGRRHEARRDVLRPEPRPPHHVHEPVTVDGEPAWVAAGDTGFPGGPPSGVRLLPYFDAYVVGRHPRELLFPGVAAERALARGQAGNFPVLLVDGVAAGVWHQRRSGRRIHITVEPFGERTPALRRALDEQAGRVGEMLEGTPSLTVGTVAVGAHA